MNDQKIVTLVPEGPTSADLPPDTRLYDIHFQAAPKPSAFGGAAAKIVSSRDLGKKIEALLLSSGLQPTVSSVGIMPHERGIEFVNINAGHPTLPPDNVPLRDLVNAYKRQRARGLPAEQDGGSDV